MPSRSAVHPLPGVEARLGTGHYGVLDHGAQAWAWQPEGQRPVLWVSSRSAFTEGRAVRGGVPLVFPWFGGGPGGALKPAHGFARVRPWRRVAVQDEVDEGGRLTVEYRLDRSMVPPTPEFPHHFTAAVRVAFAPRHLQVDLEVTNGSVTPFRFESALHTYLAVSDVRQVAVHGLEGAPYLDQAAGATERRRVQAGPIAFAGETDRIYRSGRRGDGPRPGLGPAPRDREGRLGEHGGLESLDRQGGRHGRLRRRRVARHALRGGRQHRAGRPWRWTRAPPTGSGSGWRSAADDRAAAAAPGAEKAGVRDIPG